MDTLDAQRRSENMRQIRSKNTKPEIILRSLLHKVGYRFRLHQKELPGKPDIVFPSLHKAIFVHGCFWHQHQTCGEGRVPGSRQEYWRPKLKRNQERDQAAILALSEQGWDILVVWECEIEGDLKDTLEHVNVFLKTRHRLL